MRVLIVTEDHTRDRYLLEPIVQAMFAEIGKPRAVIQTCTNPRLRGVSQALDKEMLVRIFRQYRGMVDLFLLCVDRDGVASRRNTLNQLEAFAATKLPAKCTLIGENAWQEIEVWALAGLDLPKEWNWQDVRGERDPKERYFQPIAASRRLLDEPGAGRRTLGQEAARRYGRIRQLCPEDVQVFEQRVLAWIGSRS